MANENTAAVQDVTAEAKKDIHMSQVRKERKNLRYLQKKKERGEKIVQTCPVALGPVFAMAAEVADVDLIRISSILGCHGLEEEAAAAIPTIREYRLMAKNIHINYYVPVNKYADKATAVAFGADLIQNGADTLLCMGVTNPVLKHMSDHLVPTYGHVGALSGWQTVATGYIKCGNTAKDAFRIFKMAYEYQENGMGGMTIELTPMEVGNAIAKKLRVPVLGIAAGGAACDGSEMVDMDTFGMMPSAASHAVTYAQLFPFMVQAYAAWVNDVRSCNYPQEHHGWHMKPEELEKFNTMMENF